MKRHTNKRAAIEREYVKVKKAKYEQMLEDHGHAFCAGCGEATDLTASHRIARSRRRDLIADPDNIDFLCTTCHLLVETHHYDRLLNGEGIKAYIARHEPAILHLNAIPLPGEN